MVEVEKPPCCTPEQEDIDRQAFWLLYTRYEGELQKMLAARRVAEPDTLVGQYLRHNREHLAYLGLDPKAQFSSEAVRLVGDKVMTDQMEKQFGEN